MNTSAKEISAARAQGASRTTIWRIATAKQKSYNPGRGKLPRRTWRGLPKTRHPILSIIRIGTLCTYPELCRFDRDDLIQEIAIYLAEKEWDDREHDAHVMSLSKAISATWRRDREVGSLRHKKSAGTKALVGGFETTMLRYGMDAHPKTTWPDDFVFDWENEDDLQKVLNAADPQDCIYYAFRTMRLRIADYQCDRCEHADNLTLHHIIPRSVRPVNTISNTAVLCRECHDEVEFAYGMIRVDYEPREKEYKEIFDALMSHASTEKFLKRYFKEKEHAE